MTLDGETHPTCCPGCQAVASTIIGAGHGDYYRHRDRYAAPGAGELPAVLHDLELFDRPQIQREFVQSRGDDRKEAALMLEGITCAACVWLNERHVRSLDGVLEFHVNYSTHRARLVWAPSRIALSKILAAIEAIGYRAHPYDPEREDRAQREERNAALRRLAVGGLATMQVMMIALGLWLAEADGTTDPAFLQFLRIMAALFALPVVTYVAWPFYRGAWRDLRSRRLGMDVPITIATVTTYVASAYGVWLGTGVHVYFESAAMFVFFLTASRYLELLARQRAARANQRLDRLLPAVATKVLADGELREVARAELEIGDVVRVPPGAALPGDGVVVRGATELDCALLTGESEPQRVQEGAAVIAGTINRGQSIDVRLERLGAQTELAEIQRLVERAQAAKPKVTLMAEQGTGAFIAVVLALTLAAGAVWWYWIDPERALWVMVAMLVATCPCALALATPAAQTITAGQLARLGIVLLQPDRFPTAGHLTDVVFDKTGTLTIGRPVVTAADWVGDFATSDASARQAVLDLLARAESHADHVLARAVRRYARQQRQHAEGAATSSIYEVGRVETVVGEGLVFEVQARDAPARHDAPCAPHRETVSLAGVWRIGRRHFALSDAGQDPAAGAALGGAIDEGRGVRDAAAGRGAVSSADDAASAGAGPALGPTSAQGSEVWISHEGRPVLRLTLEDPLRPEAIEAVEAFRAARINVHVFSGDRPAVVDATLARLERGARERGRSTSLDLDDAAAPSERGALLGYGDLRPGDKLARLQALRTAPPPTSSADGGPRAQAPTKRDTEGRRQVMAVGDGVNDSPLLAAADLSVAMGSGTRIAQAQADIVLLNDRVDRLAQLPGHARRTESIIRQNIGWAIAYNVLALPLAASGLLTPWMAALGMSASSLIVVANALRLHEDLDGRGRSSRNLRNARSTRAIPSRVAPE